VEAIPVFVGPGQINAIMPSNTPLGKVSIRVTGTHPRPPISSPPASAFSGSLALVPARE
jgi:hypothetical protein